MYTTHFVFSSSMKGKNEFLYSTCAVERVKGSGHSLLQSRGNKGNTLANWTYPRMTGTPYHQDSSSNYFSVERHRFYTRSEGTCQSWLSKCYLYSSTSKNLTCSFLSFYSREGVGKHFPRMQTKDDDGPKEHEKKPGGLNSRPECSGQCKSK